MAHLIAIAASQAGPAHAFMLGEALQAAATRLGHRLTLKVVSRLGTEGGYTADDARQAEAVIVAADMAVDRSDLPPVRVVETTPDAVFRDAGAVVRQALAGLGMPAAPASAAPPAATATAGGEPLRIVAITACPTGVAHTFMAAEALEQGAKA
ncbi:MAG: PTS fructose transporter subunit EIIBC, partial [Ideonella sp.]|nr:PTS fructose transporter subunit EIIBC [Ideonella sp.]